MNDLHFFIKSLSPSEKRYVSIYINKFSTSKNNYSILFDTIEKQIEYNEEAILKKHRKENFVKQLSVTKHYLFELILSAMSDYYGEQFLDWKLKKQALHIFVLTSKGLDKAAHKLILKAKKVAWQHENYFVLIDILNHEKWLYGNRRIELNNPNYGIQICEEEQNAISNLTLIQYYKTLWHRLTQVELKQNQYSIVEFKNELTKCVDDKTLIEQPNVNSYLIQTWYNSVWAHYFMLMNDTSKHFIHYQKVVELREKQVNELPQSPIDLIATYYNFMLACYQNKQWNVLEIYLDKIKHLEAKSIEKKIKIFHDYYHCLLLYYLGTKQYIKGEIVLQEVKEGLEYFGDKIRLDFKIWLCQCAGLIAFFHKNYKVANQWWLKIINMDKTLIEIKVQCKIELYCILLSIVEGDIEILEYQIKIAKKRFADNLFLGNEEKNFLRFALNVYKEGRLTKVHISQIIKEFHHLYTHNNSHLIDEYCLEWLLLKQQSNN